jgi:preprotein translocase subunit SecY
MKSAFSSWRYLWKSPDIRRKLLFTLGILVLYRMAANIPVPGVDFQALREFLSLATGTGSFLDFLNLLSGGTVLNFSLLSMGVYPYITAQIILQLLVPIIPSLEQRIKDNPTEGRRWMERWTYYLAVPMAALSAVGQINIFNSLAQQYIKKPVIVFGFNAEHWFSSLTVLIAMTAGTMFAIWLGELISEFGIRGQGLSLIIFAGIVSQVPGNLVRIFRGDVQYRWILLLLTAVVILVTIYAIVYIQQGRRNIPVTYPGRRVGNRMTMPVRGTLPLMVNMAGMIPLIFASAILQFPAIIASYFVKTPGDFASQVQQIFSGNSATYWILYFIMVVAFTFFYTDVLFTQQNYGESLKRIGAQVQGVARGEATQKYLLRVQRRITLVGALFLGIVAILPFLIRLIFPAASQGAGLFLVSSAGLLIVVGVVRDTFMTIDAELKVHGYQESLLVR